MSKKRRKHKEDKYIDPRVTDAAKMILEHKDEIVQRIDARFEESRDFLRVKLKRWIKDKLESAIHYEWCNGWEPYDHSGELKEVGSVDMDQTVYDFLENDYTGNWTPTFESGRGRNWDTYGDELCYETLNFGEDVMVSTVKDFLAENNITLSNDEFFDIRDDWHDTIYDESMTQEFFFWEFPVEFCDLEEVRLNEL